MSLAAGAATAQDSPLDYPQWRGRNRDGAASAFAEPTSWPESLTRRWKVDVGEGYATPLVIGDTVYAFTRRDGRETMTALDAGTGTVKWQTGYAAGYSPSRAAAAHGAGPKATPLFQNGTLYSLGISGILSAFDAATGRLLWQTAAPAEHPFFSAASSPAGENGLVFAHPGNYDPLTAFDANTGAVRWRATGGGFFASPILVTLAGTRQVVTVHQDSIIGVAVADGALLWRHPWRGGSGSTTPVQHADTIIVSGLDVGVTAIRPVRRDSGWIVETVWQTTSVSLYVSTAVIIGDTLFGLSHRARGQYFALDAAKRRGAVARSAARSRQHGVGEGGAPALPVERRCRADRGARQARRVRRADALHRRGQRDVGAAGRVGQPDFHQGHVVARALDRGLSWQGGPEGSASAEQKPRDLSPVIDAPRGMSVDSGRLTEGLPKRRRSGLIQPRAFSSSHTVVCVRQLGVVGSRVIDCIVL